MRIGILPLGRPTFDIDFANEKLAGMLAVLDRSGHQIEGPRELLLEPDETRAAIAALAADPADMTLLLQVTFTDAAMTVDAAKAIDAPFAIWAVPEPRIGGRLRLNSFCGLNLASHALGLNEREFHWLYRDPDGDSDAALARMLDGNHASGRLNATQTATASETGRATLAQIQGKRIARIGEAPVGFDTCRYSPDLLSDLAGLKVDEVDLSALFETANACDEDAVAELHADVQDKVKGLDEVDQHQLDKSLRLKLALDGLRRNGQYDAFAIRCWPETFTEYGGAVCGPASLMSESRVPCACEADVYGALTQLILQEVSGGAVFLTDLVDMDAADDTGVVWHCGQAPLSMLGGGAASATIHTNRKMPLLFEFPLKPGRVTFLRISQAFGQQKMILSAGEMLDRPMAFTGTSGVVRFDRQVDDVLPDLFASGLEHHMALAYGDHRAALRDVAAAMNLPVLEI